MTKTYTCAFCLGTFAEQEDWTDEDAQREADEKFPGCEPEDMAVVCEDCYVALMRMPRRPGETVH